MDITLDTKTVRYANGGCEHDPALPVWCSCTVPA